MCHSTVFAPKTDFFFDNIFIIFLQIMATKNTNLSHFNWSFDDKNLKTIPKKFADLAARTVFVWAIPLLFFPKQTF
jgi:hypothetical protein